MTSIMRMLPSKSDVCEMELAVYMKSKQTEKVSEHVR